MTDLLSQMSAEHIKRLSHCVFPENRRSFLHSMVNNFETVELMAEKAKEHGFVVPFLLDATYKTPLDNVMETLDHKLANAMLKLLSKTPLDHHGRLIAHQIPALIEMNLPHMEKYWDKRRFQPGILANITAGKISLSDD